MADDRMHTATPDLKGQLIHWAANYDRLLDMITPFHRLAAHFSHHAFDDHSDSGVRVEQFFLEAGKLGLRNIRSGTFKPRFLHRLSAETSSDD